ncbi:hypothetical protein A1O1_04967 [Capronia coronata CBS 617.96]|uniref:PARP-type domain-containing protein n=1 Tax=Capronia coronata CBS 617.96 TaxID=1182541 RepID=W9YEE9_9EURO|nr:uncharacterized protein A1O1_04967 [Capronia coronata CBS 617.96]EXJ88040.1 hypothetical protein A1O1_04967 [Capronia coronata CBS 617.96]
MSNATYRFELAKTGRANCQNSACKAAGLKIEKGELRFGTLVSFQDHFTWKWKHWGCVTPAQIKNIQEQVGPLEGLDLDDDLPRILDGYDELSPEACEKVKFALLHGHVADEDWKGEPELNRPGQKGINKRTPKKKKDAEQDDAAAANEDGTPSKPKARKSRAKKVKTEPEDDEDDLALSPPPKMKSKGRKVKAEDDEEGLASPPPVKKPRGRKRKTPDKGEEEAEEAKPTRKPRAKKVKTEEQDTVIEDLISAQHGNSDDAPAPKSEAKGKKTRAKKVKRESLDEDDAPVTSKAKTAKSKKAKKVKAEIEEDANPDADEAYEVSAPELSPTAADEDDEDAEEPEVKPKKKSTKAAPGKSRAKRKAT